MLDYLKSSEIESQEQLLPGKQLEWVEPESVKDLVNNKFYTIRKEPLGGIHKLTKHLSVGASKALFKKDANSWTSLKNKLLQVPDVLTAWENAQFVTIGDEVVTVVSHESDIAVNGFLTKLRELSAEDYVVNYRYDDKSKRFEAIAYARENVLEAEHKQASVADGIVIDLQFSKRQLKVWEAQLTFEPEAGRLAMILPVGSPVVKGNINQDLIDNMGALEEYIDSSDASSLLQYIQEEINTKLSLGEAVKYLKKAGLVVKGKNVDAEIADFDYGVQQQYARMLVYKMDEVNVSYDKLKTLYDITKATTFLTMTYRDLFCAYSQIIDQVEGTKLRLASLADLMTHVNSGKTHFKQVKQVAAVE